MDRTYEQGGGGTGGLWVVRNSAKSTRSRSARSCCCKPSRGSETLSQRAKVGSPFVARLQYQIEAQSPSKRAWARIREGWLSRSILVISNSSSGGFIYASPRPRPAAVSPCSVVRISERRRIDVYDMRNMLLLCGF